MKTHYSPETLTVKCNYYFFQHVEEAKELLRKMIRTAGIRDDDLVTLQLVGDLSYAWELVDSFTMDMQDGIKRDPALVGKLRATFLKVSNLNTLGSFLF